MQNFRKGEGGRKFRKVEINEDQNKNFPPQNQFRSPAQTLVKTKKKRKVFTQIHSGFWHKIRWRSKKKVFTQI